MKVLENVNVKTSGQTPYEIEKIYDFLRTDMGDLELLYAVNLWYKSQCDAKRFFENYDSTVFEEDSVMRKTKLRDCIRGAKASDVRKLCRNLDRAIANNLDWLDLPMDDLVNLFIGFNFLDQNIITLDKLRKVSKKINYKINKRKDFVYITNNKTGKQMIILKMDPNNDLHVLLYEPYNPKSFKKRKVVKDADNRQEKRKRIRR